MAAWPGGLCLPRTAIHLTLIGSIPAASGMSHGHVASELSTFSPRFCLSHPAFLSVSLSCRILVPMSLFISLFSAFFFFLIACLRASSLIFPCPRSNPRMSRAWGITVASTLPGACPQPPARPSGQRKCKAGEYRGHTPLCSSPWLPLLWL